MLVTQNQKLGHESDTVRQTAGEDQKLRMGNRLASDTAHQKLKLGH